MALPFTDDFNRANASPPDALGANWNDNTDGFSIVSNKAECTTAGMQYVYDGVNTYTNDQSAQCVVSTVADGGPMVRASLGNGYLFDAKTSGSNVQKFVGSSFAGTLFSLSGNPSAGDTIKLTVVGDTLTAYINGVSVGSGSGTGALSSGQPGIWNFGPGGIYDDFVGDNVPPTGGGSSVTSKPAQIELLRPFNMMRGRM